MKELLQQAHADYHDNVTNVTEMTMQMLMQVMVGKGEWSREQAEELKEAIKVLRQPSPDPTSILSKQSKLGK